MNKIHCLNAISKEIVNSINAFWQGIPIKDSKLIINGEELLMIFTYLVSHGMKYDLFA
jgi:hypothetical protein